MIVVTVTCNHNTAREAECMCVNNICLSVRIYSLVYAEICVFSTHIYMYIDTRMMNICTAFICTIHFLPDVTEDFTIDSPLVASSFAVELFLGPTVSRSCFTINTINDVIPEIPTKTYQFFIPTVVDGPSVYQVLPTSSTRTVTILDDDCKCV